MKKNRAVFAVPTLLRCRVKLKKELNPQEKQKYEKKQNLWADGEHLPVKND